MTSKPTGTSPAAALREAQLALWVMFVVIVVALGLVAAAERVVHHRMEELEAEFKQLRSRFALQEAQHQACGDALRDWNRWLELRREGWGSAHFVKVETAP